MHAITIITITSILRRAPPHIVLLSPTIVFNSLIMPYHGADSALPLQ